MRKAARKKEHRITLLHVFGVAWFFIALIFLGMPGVTHAQDKALENLRETGKAFASVAKNASPAVVFIRVEKTVSQGPFLRHRSPFEDEFFKRFFGEPGPGFPQFPQQQQKRQVQSQGSGFIITPDGYILTNNHVVGDADRVTVKLLDGREFTAKTVGTDPPTDVAVIKIDAERLPVLSLGDSDRIEVGEWVLALGNPFGLSHTLTAGIVSAKGRSSVGITDYEDFIQTDAAINPGNSGGPLIDLQGKVVGINTAIYSRNGGGYMGIGFAIPVNLAKNIYTQLIEHGNVTRGYLGVTIQDLTAELAKSFGLDDTRGVLVSQVMPDTPAEKAGMKQGDVIVSLNGKPVDASASLRNEVAMTVPGSTIKVGVIRDGKSKTLSVKVEKMSEDMLTSSRSEDMSSLGMSVATLTKDLAKQYGFENESGVVITGVDQGSAAARAGIKPGMLVKEVNRRPVKNVKEFENALKKGGKKPVLLFIKDDRGSHFVAIDPGK